ncbi:MAG: hypothetical protein ABWZ66_10540 [Pyrinomonadaceae bacterium]
MKKLFAASLVILCFSVLPVFAQTANIVKSDLSQTEINKIVAKFTKNEALFRKALNIYAYNRTAMIQSIGMGGQISGVFRMDSFHSFDASGERIEKILFAPMPTLKDMTVSREDIDNLSGVNPFAIEPSSVANYNFTYLGKEHIDELDLYVFEVSPKTLPDPRKSNQKYFSGRIWVDTEDLLIVRSKGKALPEGKNMQGLEQKFPVMETWRDRIDGKYWFPVLSSSDDELIFDDGHAVKLKVRVKYTNYRVGRVDVKIGDDEVEVKEETKPTPTKKP